MTSILMLLLELLAAATALPVLGGFSLAVMRRSHRGGRLE
jgi:hypothetical protein